jgi:hypothetical protein
MTEQTYDYFECPACEFNSVRRAPCKGSRACPLCAEDSGRTVLMTCRPATEDDIHIEGFDARTEDA